MSDRRLIDSKILTTDFSTAKSVGAKLLIDSSTYSEAKNIAVELLGNSYIQGSTDGITYSDTVNSSTQYLKVSTNGGTNSRVIPILTEDTHEPLSLNITNGLVLDAANQILSLNLATTSNAGALSATDKLKVDKLITNGDGLSFLSNDGTYQVIDLDTEANTASNLGAGTGIYSTKVGVDLQFKSIKSSDGSIGITPSSTEIDLTVTGLGGGEANTASNEGISGVGVFHAKTGINFEFRTLNPQSNRLSVVLDSLNKEIDIDVVETNIDHDNLSNFVSTEHVDHSSVSVIAGTALSGTGTIESDITLDLDIDSLTINPTPEGTDYLVVYDPDTLSHYKVAAADIPVATLWNNISGNIADNTDLQDALDEKVDITTTLSTIEGIQGGGTLDANRTLSLNFNGLSSVTPALGDILAIYDVSNTIHAKMTVQTLSDFIQSNITWDYSTQALSGTTPTLDVTSGMGASITLSGTTTITMSNLEDGMSGNIDITNAATAYDITLSGYTFVISPALTFTGDTITMSGSSLVDCLSWWYDGTRVFVNGTYDYQ